MDRHACYHNPCGKIQSPESFDLIHAPLSGTNLIESGAGTGKTYTIAGLFLRLILEKGLSVEEILVVTFTKAATEELKERIRRKLLEARRSIAAGAADDPLIDALMKKRVNRCDADLRIREALGDFDAAAIFTIHGFCQRILMENAFETGSLFNTEVRTETYRMLQAVADDFWRTHLYDMPPEVIGYAIHEGGLKSPAAFLDLLARYDRPDMEIIPSAEPDALSGLEPFRKLFSRIRAEWPLFRETCARLLADPNLKANIYGSLEGDGRKTKIRALVDAVDRWTDPASVGFPLFKSFENLTADKLIRSTKKGRPAPEHPFFDRCTRLAELGAVLTAEVEQVLLSLKARMFQFADAQLRVRKQEENVLFYNDLLATVDRALDPPGGGTLTRRIRSRYKAALVDEFQDTDALQYKIFSRLFGQKDAVLFMIGDPKQAIYGFRGADIFSYLRAVRDADERYTLTVNWRSEPDLIAAVNTIFCHQKPPFLFPEITYARGVAAKPPNPSLRGEESALSLWYLDSTTEKPVTKTEATRCIAEHVAEEIFNLTRHTGGRSGAEEIAVLVRTNRQARIIKSLLSVRGVPAVLYQAGNVFDAPEALEIERILASISEPRNERRFRASLATDIMGLSGESMESLDGRDLGWEALRRNFQEYLDIWRADGFVRMFRRFLSREKIRGRLLSHPDGDRRLTNVLHIGEILQNISVERRLGVTGLVKWLSEQRDPHAPRLEEHQLRLESDAHAVTIATIHRSKGLEYDTVFCPFAWEGSVISDCPVVFHRPDAAKRLCLDLGSENCEEHKRIAQNELLSENLRILYVAVTRAKRKCYLVWGRIRGAETAAPAYLFHYTASEDSPDVVSDLRNQMRRKRPEEWLADIRRVVGASGGAISFRSLPPEHRSSDFQPAQNGVSLFGRHFNGKIGSAWKISSYSSWIDPQDADLEAPDRDVDPHGDPPDADVVSVPNLFSFPRGVRAGLFFHDILENAGAASADDRRSLIRAKLNDYGFDPDWEGAVFDMIRQVFSVPLPADMPSFSLSDVAPTHRIHEMAFHFPLQPVPAAELKDIFTAYGGHSIPEGFSERLGRLAYSPAAGFMKGYVDLVFEHRGKFFLVDWKSNYLGPRIEDYRREALVPVMMEGYYYLQYYLYALALDRYLAQRVPGYRYEARFGGIFYLFLRGMDAARGPAFGVFQDVPNFRIIAALRSALIPESMR